MPQAVADYIARALRETLDSIVSPELRDRIVRSALQSAAMAQLPTHPSLFRQFMEGPLRESVLRTLGAELGASVMYELSSVVTAAERDLAVRSSRRPSNMGGSARSSSPPPVGTPPTSPINHPPAHHLRTPISAWAPSDVVRPSPTMPSRGNTNRPPITPRSYELDPPDASQRQQQELRHTDPYDDERRAPTQPAPDSGPGELMPPSSKNYPLGTANALGVIGTASVEPGNGKRTPLVLVASSNADLVRNFGAWLDPRASVQRVRGVSAMFQDLAAASERRIVIVLDARAPSVRPLSLAAIADELPPGTKVVLWGVGADVYSKMLIVSGSVAKWLVCGTESPTSEVVAQCARLVG
ncbi:MAG TPA: hypothetical protein VM686_12985 [Polyangiaceae bacterium]|nr:hypothetical protein [Polyangiaceae bacterium]